MSLHALEVVLPVLGRLPVLDQPLLPLLALGEKSDLLLVLVLPGEVTGHQCGLVSFLRLRKQE